MTYRFPILSLRKLYLYITVSIILLILLVIASLVITTLFLSVNSNVVSIVLTTTSIISSYVVFGKIEKKLTKKITVTVNSDEIIFNKNHSHALKNIESIDVKSFSKNYPSIVIHLQDQTKHKIRCSEKYNDDFRELTQHLQKVVKTD